MEETIIILLYIGAILVAGDYALSKISHLPVFIFTPFVNLAVRFLRRLLIVGRTLAKSHSKAVRIILRVLYFIPSSLVIILILTFCVTAALIVMFLWTVSRIPLYVNQLFNAFYKSQLKGWQSGLITGIRKLAPQSTDEQILKALEEMNIPFVAILGLIILTIGFVLQLVR